VRAQQSKSHSSVNALARGRAPRSRGQHIHLGGLGLGRRLHAAPWRRRKKGRFSSCCPALQHLHRKVMPGARMARRDRAPPRQAHDAYVICCLVPGRRRMHVGDTASAFPHPRPANAIRRIGSVRSARTGPPAWDPSEQGQRRSPAPFRHDFYPLRGDLAPSPAPRRVDHGHARPKRRCLSSISASLKAARLG
jgi:hypothetical protein